VKCVLRVDASDAIGSGHLSRCLALAEALRADGAQTLFLCRDHPGHGGERVRAAGHALRLLPLGTSPARQERELAHAGWLGVSWQEDARACADAIADAFGGPADWLVVDHYALDERWEQALRAQARRILAIDDIADRRHAADALLDQNLVEEMHTRYRERVADGTVQLLGPRFALLARGYAAAHLAARVRTGPVRRVCAFFGGGAAGALGEDFLAAFGAKPRGYELDLVLPFGADPASMSPPRGARLHANLPSLAPLLEQAYLAVGGAGVNSWERLCLGVPAVVLALADNQRGGAEAMARQGLVRYLGPVAEVSAEALVAAVDAISAEALEQMSRRGLGLVDGLGAARVAAYLAAGAHTPLHARPVRLHDEALLLEWANDAEARAQAFHRTQIGAEEHARWLRARLDSDGCRLFIVETGAGLPVGQVRFERRESDWVISYSIDAALRGRGLGGRVLATGLEALCALEPEARVSGLVKHGNAASRRVFEQLGFARGDLGDALEYRRDLRGFRADAHR
jgi:UDP-2,4-diacetamido-2,4,6-trideoxy-beta-L-altropyranose hydrolase